MKSAGKDLDVAQPVTASRETGATATAEREARWHALGLMPGARVACQCEPCIRQRREG